jgi:hypothetical protein
MSQNNQEPVLMKREPKSSIGQLEIPANFVIPDIPQDLPAANRQKQVSLKTLMSSGSAKSKDDYRKLIIKKAEKHLESFNKSS